MQLLVQYHGAGQGFADTPNGAYTCAFDKARYTMTEAGNVVVQLIAKTNARFEIQSVEIYDDTANEYGSKVINPRKASFYGANQTAQSIYFAVMVRDTVANETIACDPEVMNVPE